ncbi:MAG: ShlB/FhaC/HecB family hemolysin secretion/activation protein, partial [Candidatus Omnitrophota bacterium]
TYLREKKGYLLSRAYFPGQDVTAGMVKIVIIAGRLEGQVNVVLDKPYRVNRHLVENISGRAIPEGQTILLGSVERAVLLINDLSGLSARAYLDKGEVPGTSRITLHAAEGPWASGSISGDNFGNRYTGSFRRIGQVALHDSFGRGDLLQMSYINAANLDQGQAQLSLPLGYQGVLLDVAYSGLRYELGGKLEDLKAMGSAHTASASIVYPLERTRFASLWIGIGHDYYWLEDKIDSQVNSDRNISVGNVNLTGNFYDDFAHGGLTSFLISVSAGRNSITDGREDDEAGACTKGHFTRMNYAAARLQQLWRNISLFLSARGQLADRNLDSSQKITLGGPNGVRAYPIGEASGAEGHIFTVEKRVDLPFTPAWAKTQFIGFIDAGYVKMYENTWANSVTNISGRNHYWISGFGPGINIQKKGSYRLQFSYAHTIGKNPGRDTLDHHVDNRSDKGRFWAQATIWF